MINCIKRTRVGTELGDSEVPFQRVVELSQLGIGGLILLIWNLHFCWSLLKEENQRLF